MASYIFTLGFHEDFIIRRLMNSKASKGERIIVFTVSPVSGASEKAFKNLEAFCAPQVSQDLSWSRSRFLEESLLR